MVIMKVILAFITTIITSLVLTISLPEGFPELENTYVNDKCGVSIQYPDDWTVEESDFVYKDKSKTLANFYPEDDFLIFGVSMDIMNLGVAKYSMWEISEYQKDLATFNTDSTIINAGITKIDGFPTHKIVYTEGMPDEYELQKEKFHTMEYLIIAYDREYKLTFEATDKKEFNKYSSIAEEMANSIKISKPNFKGINC